MTPHVWSNPVCVYELFAGFKCRSCGAVCFSPNELPTVEDLGDQLQDGPIPIDCAATKPLVEAGKFGWNQEEMPPWDEEDVGKWSWP